MSDKKQEYKIAQNFHFKFNVNTELFPGLCLRSIALALLTLTDNCALSQCHSEHNMATFKLLIAAEFEFKNNLNI